MGFAHNIRKHIAHTHFCSGMLSHDTRLRCDLVDVYYTLYGSKRPVCLPIPELAGLMHPQKVDVKKSTPHIPKLLPNPEIKHSPNPKDTSTSIIIDDNLECMNVEVVASDGVKVSGYLTSYSHTMVSLILSGRTNGYAN